MLETIMTMPQDKVLILGFVIGAFAGVFLYITGNALEDWLRWRKKRREK